MPAEKEIPNVGKEKRWANKWRFTNVTLQGTNTYPTWGSSENHRLKSALVGDMLVPWRAYQNPHFVCVYVCVLTALGQKRVVLWSGCVPYGMNSGCLLSPSLS